VHNMFCAGVFVERDMPRKRFLMTLKLLNVRPLKLQHYVANTDEPIENYYVDQDADTFALLVNMFHCKCFYVYLQTSALAEFTNFSRLLTVPIKHIDGLSSLTEAQQKSVIAYFEPHLNKTHECLTNLLLNEDDDLTTCKLMFEKMLLPLLSVTKIRDALAKTDVAGDYEVSLFQSCNICIQNVHTPSDSNK
jgi:hypothetical protein